MWVGVVVVVVRGVGGWVFGFGGLLCLCLYGLLLLWDVVCLVGWWLLWLFVLDGLFLYLCAVLVLLLDVGCLVVCCMVGCFVGVWVLFLFWCCFVFGVLDFWVGWWCGGFGVLCVFVGDVWVVVLHGAFTCCYDLV